MIWTERKNIDGWLAVLQSDDGRWQIEPMENFHVEHRYALVDLHGEYEEWGGEIVTNDSNIEALKRVAEERT